MQLIKKNMAKPMIFLLSCLLVLFLGSVHGNQTTTCQNDLNDDFTKCFPSQRWKYNKTFEMGNIVVDKDGSAHYKTINEAVGAAAARRRDHKERIIIHVRKGIYEEKVEIPKNLTKLMIIGDGINTTVITCSKHVERQGEHTYATATVSVEGEGFIAKNITIRNTAGPGSQAVALFCNADKSVFHKCSFEGFQDTLFVHSNSQFYSNCDIYGTTDFIFGGAKVVLQECNIYVRRFGDQGENFIAAPGGHKNDSAIVIQNSRIKAAPELELVKKKFRTYLGRPWREYSRLVYIENDIDDVIDPKGWFIDIGGDSKGVYFVEYMSRGRGGSRTGGRFRGEFFRVSRSEADVEKYTVEKFLDGGSWIREANVSFVAGL